MKLTVECDGVQLHDSVIYNSTSTLSGPQIKILQLAVEKQRWLNGQPEDIGTCDSMNKVAIRIQPVFDSAF